MEAGKLSCCNGPPHHPPCPPACEISRRRLRVDRAAAAVSVASFHFCDRPSPLSIHCSLLPVVGSFLDLAACPPVRAAEEGLSSAEAASAKTVGTLAESAGSVTTQAVQSSAESINNAVGSQAVQSSLGSVRDVASKTGGEATVGDGNVVINILGTTAFVALCALTIAVSYLLITDFLAKRKNDEELKRLNEEEVAARKKKKGSLTPASKGGAKGFGRRQDSD